MGLCFEISRWLDRLWSEHLALSTTARHLVEAGIRKQGDAFAGFPADIHARLYLPADPTSKEGPAWAIQLHTLASELAEWQRLRQMCARNGFAAGIAAEAMLGQLLPLVPDRPPEPRNSPQDGSTPGEGGDHAGDDSGVPGAGSSMKEPFSAIPEADLRAALRRATREARDAVQQAEAELEGMSTPLGYSMPGTAAITNGGPANLKAIRDAHSRLRSSARLRRITELAGRLERIAATKARSRVKPGVGEVHGIDLGADVSRLLPSELVALRHPRLRLALLSRLLQRRALCYGMKGKEPQARGPIVVLLDESSSMREGSKDVWSKAVCLALLSTATRQKRAWHLVAFNGAIRREVEVTAGQATPELIQQALDSGCAGGTDFDAPVLKAVEIIKTSRVMKNADVVLITDGEDDLEAETVEAATRLTRTEGVSWFAIGVGQEAQTYLRSLEPIATNMVAVRDTTDSDPVVPVINLDSEVAA
jgi:Mg-chelatase subunit ChlD